MSAKSFINKPVIHMLSGTALATACFAISGTPALPATFSPAFLAQVAAGDIPRAAPLAPDETELLSRISPADYAPDNAMSGTDRPAPRAISNALSVPENVAEQTKPLSRLAVAMLQLMASHEIASTPSIRGATGDDRIDIALEPGDDVYFDGPIPQTRSQYVLVDGQREQINEVTSAFDGSTIYGSTEATLNMLIDRVDNGDESSAMTGFMRTSPSGGLPEFPVLMPDGSPVIGSDGMPVMRVMSGDARADENPTLQATHELFMSEHNRLAGLIIEACGAECSGAEVFDAARYLVTEAQEKIFYEEILPVFLGNKDLSLLLPDPEMVKDVEGAFNAYTSAAGRIGHTMVPETILTAVPGKKTGEVDLKECFFDSNCMGDTSMTEILYGGMMQQAEPFDPFVVDALRNALIPGFGVARNVDLLATNINRGRDHAIPDYFSLRAALGFDDTTAPLQDVIASLLPASLLDLYGYSDLSAIGSIFDIEIDLLAGLFSELRLGSDYLGETSKALWALQFLGLKQDNEPAALMSFVMGGSFENAAKEYLDGVSLTSLLGNNTEFGEEHWKNPLFAAVPLPAAALMLLSGLTALFALRRRPILASPEPNAIPIAEAS